MTFKVIIGGEGDSQVGGNVYYEIAETYEQAIEQAWEKFRLLHRISAAVPETHLR